MIRLRFLTLFLAAGFLALLSAPVWSADTTYLVFFRNGRIFKASFVKEEGEWTHVSLNLRNRFTIKTDLIDRIEKRIETGSSTGRSSNTYPGQAVTPTPGANAGNRRSSRSPTKTPDQYKDGNPGGVNRETSGVGSLRPDGTKAQESANPNRSKSPKGRVFSKSDIRGAARKQ